MPFHGIDLGALPSRATMAHSDRSSPPDSHSGEAGALPACAANFKVALLTDPIRFGWPITNDVIGSKPGGYIFVSGVPSIFGEELA